MRNQGFVREHCKTLVATTQARTRATRKYRGGNVDWIERRRRSHRGSNRCVRA